MHFDDVKHTINALMQPEYQRELVDTDWLLIADVYLKASIKEQRQLLTFLSNHTGIAAPTLAEGLISIPKLNPSQKSDLFGSWLKVQKTLSQDIEAFKSRTLVQQLNIENINILRNEWHQIIKRFNQLKRQNLSAPFLINELSNIKRLDFEDVEAMLSLPNPQRKVKQSVKELSSNEAKESFKKRKRHDSNDNFIIAEQDNLGLPLPAKRLEPATPSRVGTKRMRSPNGTRYRMFGEIDGRRLHTQDTPQKPRQNFSSENLNNHIPTRSSEMTFEATRTSFEQRSGKSRPLSQRAIMGDSAHHVFLAHGDELAIHSRSQDYHWAHIVAYVLGGEHSARNLIPATAAANYTMLEAIERHLIDLLKTNRSSKINIKVNLLYADEHVLIPDELHFELSWSEPGLVENPINKFEQFHIKPRSETRLSRQMRDTLAALRASPQNEDAAQNSDDDWLKSSI